ncbi:serine/threonine kinase-like domain-containing protein STKLD1 isoform X1 [Sycon ciliatum]|uniref:serine/threonine kinase-like domain-containing protein STKLD1 isoform X1 n=2 Tax=Sycon ciliatum TaxID=27933 RepID=UPI0031F716F0
MDHYTIAGRLGRGSQGCVYMVYDKRIRKQFVMKQIECADKRSADKAFDEAQALSQLKHKYICGYREFFVMWDQKNQSMNVCIVMDYYKMGDLDQLMERKRKEKEPLDEMMIKKWTGQMVDALIFVHDMAVIHRDLKPSNIFLTEDLSVRIGDFGVSTVMGNQRTKTRTIVGSMAWMAPEVLERPYDERSDVWSLACIILEMTTCGLMLTKAVREALLEMKQIPQRLEEILDTIKAEYSPDLGHLLRTMLRRNFHQRPSARELMEVEYCRQCLMLVKSEYVEKYELSLVEVFPVDHDATISQAINHMDTHSDSSGTAIDCLQHLCTLTEARDKSMTDAEKQVVLHTMKRFKGDEAIQTLSLQLMIHLLDADEQSSDDYLYKIDAVHPVCLAMRKFGNSAPLQTTATELLMVLSTDENAAAVIGETGGVQDILSALRAFPNSPVIATNCCTAVWSLCASEELSAIVTEERGILDVRNAMDIFKDHVETVEAANSAIYSLSLEEDNITIMLESEVISSILACLVVHLQDSRIPRVASLALSSVVEVEGQCLDQLLAFKDAASGMSGAELVVESLKLHMESEDTAGNLAALLMDMSDDDVAAAQLMKADAPALLEKTRQLHAANQEICTNCQIGKGRLLESAERSTAGSAASSKPQLERVASMTRDKVGSLQRSRPSTARRSSSIEVPK